MVNNTPKTKNDFYSVWLMGRKAHDPQTRKVEWVAEKVKVFSAFDLTPPCAPSGVILRTKVRGVELTSYVRDVFQHFIDESVELPDVKLHYALVATSENNAVALAACALTLVEGLHLITDALGGPICEITIYAGKETQEEAEEFRDSMWYFVYGNRGTNMMLTVSQGVESAVEALRETLGRLDHVGVEAFATQDEAVAEALTCRETIENKRFKVLKNWNEFLPVPGVLL